VVFRKPPHLGSRGGRNDRVQKQRKSEKRRADKKKEKKLEAASREKSRSSKKSQAGGRKSKRGLKFLGRNQTRKRKKKAWTKRSAKPGLQVRINQQGLRTGASLQERPVVDVNPETERKESPGRGEGVSKKIHPHFKSGRGKCPGSPKKKKLKVGRKITHRKDRQRIRHLEKVPGTKKKKKKKESIIRTKLDHKGVLGQDRTLKRHNLLFRGRKYESKTQRKTYGV